MSYISRNTWRSRIFTFMAAAALAVPVVAQQATIRSVVRVRVKVDRLGDYQTATKEYNTVLKKGGVSRARTVWTSQSGPIGYLLVQYYKKWAELDSPQDPKLKEHAADMTRITARIAQCVESADRIIEEVLPELSTASLGAIPKMVIVLRSRVRPERVNDYPALMKSDLFPAVTKSELKGYSIARARFGAPSSEFTSVAPLNGWTDLDGTSWITKAMGQDGYERFVAKVRGLIAESEWNIYRHQPDLSYIPASPGTTGGN